MTVEMTRKAKFTEPYPARFTPGTNARMEAVLVQGEDRADFIRDAVEREIKRRERGKAKG